MGVAQHGVHYESTVTSVRTLVGAVLPTELTAAIAEAQQEWARAERGRSADEAPVTVEPLRNTLVVKVALTLTRHDVRPGQPTATRAVPA